MDEEPPTGRGTQGDDVVHYLPGVSPPDGAGGTTTPDGGAVALASGCVQLVWLLIKLVVLLGLLAFIIWFLVVLVTTAV